MADFTYRLDKRLIIVPAFIRGRLNGYDVDLILDTGASLTIIDPALANRLGFGEKDRVGTSTMQSPVGKEKGFRLKLNTFECLGKTVENFEVACHALGLQHIDGLIGMNFLEQFDFCLYSKKGIIRI